MSKPKILLKGANLHVDQHIVTLRSRRKTRLLLEAFMSDDEASIDRERIRKAVYSNDAILSERLRASQNCSLNKLISRSRSFLKGSLEDSAWEQRIDWFVYCSTRKRWSLYRLQDQASHPEKGHESQELHSSSIP